MSQQTVEDVATNSPTAWFAVLERARIDRNQSLEQRALRHLRRLGVSVTFTVEASQSDRMREATR